MPHVDPPRRRVRDVVGDAALLVLADGKRAVVRPRHPRVVLVLCGADVYQSSVERRQARVAEEILVGESGPRLFTQFRVSIVLIRSPT